jgi:hypothetical protein
MPRRAYIRANPDFPLRASIFCQCGRPLTGSWSKSRAGKRYPFYHCPRAGCKARARKEALQTRFTDLLSELQPDPAYSDLFAQLLAEEAESHHAETRNRRQGLSKAVEEWESKRRILLDRFLYDRAI